MAKTVTWAFLFRSDGTNPEVDKAEMIHCGNRFLIYGTNTIEEGCEVAKRLVEEENCVLIELCGGYGEKGAKQVIEAIGGKIPVGHTVYHESERPKLNKTDYIPWAFIFRSDGCDPEVDKLVLHHCGNRMLVYGTNTIEEGCEVAKRIVEEEGCELIELCGGYGPDGARKMIEAIDGKSPIGHVVYLESEIPKLSILHN